MTITREQVADVVEISDPAWRGSIVRGPLILSRWGKPGLALGVTSRPDETFQIVVRKTDGNPSRWGEYRTLTSNPARVDVRSYGPLRLLWDGATGQVVPS